MLSNEWRLIKRRKTAASFRRMPDSCDHPKLAASDGAADALAFTQRFEARRSARRLSGAADLASHDGPRRERFSLWRRHDRDGAQLKVFALLSVQVRRVAIDRRNRAARAIRREAAIPTQAIVFELFLVG